MTQINSLLREIDRTRDSKLNILTINAHERYECGLAKTGHNFFAIQGEGLKTWDNRYDIMPSNYSNLNGVTLPVGIYPDIIISHQKVGGFQQLYPIAQRLQIPIISLEHCYRMPNWSPGHLAHFKSMKGFANVFIHKMQGHVWGWDEGEFTVIEHGVNTELFKPNQNIERKKIVGACVNDWPNRGAILGFDIWQEATAGLPTEVLGASPGFSEPAKSIQDLAEHYQSWEIFCNTSIYSTYPTVCLEAAASECAIVTTSTCALSDIFEHENTAYIADNAKDMRKAIKHLLKNPEECRRIGQNARQMVLNRFGMDRFVKDWNKVLFDTLERWRP